jgi:hypothetical protein
VSGLSGPGSQVRHERILASVARISRFSRGLDRAIEQIGGKEAWLRRWSAPDQEEDLLVAALERQYERIVNALQDEVIDLLEAEAVDRGLAPRPPRATDLEEASRWNREAVALRLISDAPNPDEAPGRWRRAALLGWLSSSTALALRDLVRSRQLFAHRYVGASGEQHGADVWADAHALRALLPQVSRELRLAVERLWPAPD